MPSAPPPPPPGGITGPTITLTNANGTATAMVLVDGTSKQINAGVGPEREVQYLCPWDTSDVFMDCLIGTRGISGGIGGAAIFPVFHAYPGNTNILCYRCHAVGIGIPGPDTIAGKLIRFSGLNGGLGYAKITAAYKRPVFDYYGTDTLNSFGGQPMLFAEYRQRGSTEGIPIPRNVLTLPSGDPSPVSVKYEMPVKEYMLRLHYRAWNPETVLDPFLAKTNLNPFWGKAKGTVRLSDYDADLTIDGGGNMNQIVEMRFLWRPIDWNYLPDDGTLTFDLATDSLANVQYPYIDFSPMLQL